MRSCFLEFKDGSGRLCHGVLCCKRPQWHQAMLVVNSGLRAVFPPPPTKMPCMVAWRCLLLLLSFLAVVTALGGVYWLVRSKGLNVQGKYTNVSYLRGPRPFLTTIAISGMLLRQHAGRLDSDICCCTSWACLFWREPCYVKASLARLFRGLSRRRCVVLPPLLGREGVYRGGGYPILADWAPSMRHQGRLGPVPWWEWVLVSAVRVDQSKSEEGQRPWWITHHKEALVPPSRGCV